MTIGGRTGAMRCSPACLLKSAAALCFALFLAVAAAGASENVRVAISDNRRTVTLRAAAGLVVEGGAEDRGTATVTISAAAAGRVPVRVRSRSGIVAVNGRPYRGIVEVRKKANGLLQVINDLDIEDYLKGVIAAEIPNDWDMEALKAQAVASRTYAVYQKRASGKRAYHILDTVDSQVYLGVRGERRRALSAVERTRGEIVLYDGEVIAAFYHSSCGGHTEDASVLWGIDEPYLKGVDCNCQEISAYGLWEKRFSIPTVVGALRRDGYRLDRIDSVECGMLTPGGRVMDVRFRSRGNSTSVPAETIRAALGYSRVPSIFFEPELIDSEVVFSGRGLGHGVGLCQWGALELARRGFGYKAILKHYYPGTTIEVR